MRHSNFIVPVAFILVFYLLHILLMRKKNKTNNRQAQTATPRAEYNILQSQIEMQEQTFQKISTEIHDNISLTLSLSKLYLHDLDFNDQSQVSDRVRLSRFLLRKAIEDLNSLSKSLSSDCIEKFGIIRSVEDLVNEVRNTGVLTISLSVKGIQRSLGSSDELILFRMIQESLNNIIRHSNARMATIAMKYETSTVSVNICDDGQGFDPATINKFSGSGLGNMKKRAQMINANLMIESSPRCGTSIKILVPVKTN